MSRNPNGGAENIEIERKFLLDSDNFPADLAARGSVYQFVQTYISYSPELRVRKVDADGYYFTMKLPKDNIGLSREEIEFPITEREYNDLLPKQEGAAIYKTRYQFYEGGHLAAADVYSRELAGLAVAEVEFETVAQAERYTPPAWFGKEVTSDQRYKNANLARYGLPNDSEPV
ncbi:MAG: CYTH domain-containing protein [Clostridiales bacterium]|jgi:CYTH domain-containing protein|nr:CYTH domain-containing protein [Clostridiales bacterium]